MSEECIRLRVMDAMGSREIQVESDLVSTGRRSSCDIRLTAPDASKDHAEIVRMGVCFMLRDRGSRFGTFVNGERIGERVLRDGDRIELGKSGGVVLTFLRNESTGELSGHSTVITELG